MSGAERTVLHGRRYQVVQAFSAPLAIMFHAPFSDRYEGLVPSGLELELVGEALPNATVSARPLDPDRWENLLVRPEDYENELFGGCYIIVPLDELERACQPI